MPGHGETIFELPAGFVVVCDCGWHSTSVRDRDLAVARWSLHVDRATLAANREEWRRVVAEAQGRRARAADMCAAARRQQIRTAELRRSLAHHRAPARAAVVSSSRVLGQRLGTALLMAGRTIDELWLAYVGYGGGASLQGVTDMLAGTAPISPKEHDLLAITLNEWFRDAGFGDPVEGWDAASTSLRH